MSNEIKIDIPVRLIIKVTVVVSLTKFSLGVISGVSTPYIVKLNKKLNKKFDIKKTELSERPPIWPWSNAKF